jgi:hypothetical protein
VYRIFISRLLSDRRRILCSQVLDDHNCRTPEIGFEDKRNTLLKQLQSFVEYATHFNSSCAQYKRWADKIAFSSVPLLNFDLYFWTSQTRRLCLPFFFSPPFTVQRLCELLVNPGLYSNTHRYLFAVDKVCCNSCYRISLNPANSPRMSSQPGFVGHLDTTNVVSRGI